jgi:hypothetical protein
VNVNTTNKQIYALIFQRYSKIIEKLQLPTSADELASLEEDK